jgi:hypothetical protein
VVAVVVVVVVAVVVVVMAGAAVLVVVVVGGGGQVHGKGTRSNTPCRKGYLNDMLLHTRAEMFCVSSRCLRFVVFFRILSYFGVGIFRGTFWGSSGRLVGA